MSKKNDEVLKAMIENSYINSDGIIWMSINKDNKHYEKIKAMILECENDGN